MESWHKESNKTPSSEVLRVLLVLLTVDTLGWWQAGLPAHKACAMYAFLVEGVSDKTEVGIYKDLLSENKWIK